MKIKVLHYSIWLSGAKPQNCQTDFTDIAARNLNIKVLKCYTNKFTRKMVIIHAHFTNGNARVLLNLIKIN